MNARSIRQAFLRAVAVGVAFAPGAVHFAGAHHSILPFDGARVQTISGVVVRFVWQNPHTHIYLDVTTAAGGVERWAVESEGANALRRLGWTKDTIAPGYRLAVTGARARNDARVMRCETIELDDGRRLPCLVPIETLSRGPIEFPGRR